MVEHQRADLRQGRRAQRTADRGGAGHGVAHRIAQERHADDPVLAVIGQAKAAGQPACLAALPVRQHHRIAHRAFHAREGRRLREGPAQLGMVARAMVAFPVVLPDQLPVALLDDRLLERDLGVGQPMGREIGLGRGLERREVGRRIGDADEHQPAHAARMHRLERIGCRVEVLAHPAPAHELAVEAVAPLVIGTDEARGLALGGGADQRATMPAAVVESPDLAVAAAHEQDGILPDLQGQIVAARR